MRQTAIGQTTLVDVGPRNFACGVVSPN